MHDSRSLLAFAAVFVAAAAFARSSSGSKSTAPAGLDPTVAKPPVAKKVRTTSTVHGETRADDYAWLREKGSPAVTAHLEAENAYTAAVMKPTKGLEETLYKEMVSRTKETDISVPWPKNGFWYYSRTDAGKQYPTHCRKAGSADGPEQVLLDENAMAEGKKYFELGDFTPSDDGKLLLFSTDETGYRQYTLQVKNLETGEILPDRAEKVTGAVWAADGKTIFYVTEDAAKRPAKLYRHVLGATTPDPLIYEETDELFRIDLSRTGDDAFVVVSSNSSTTAEVRVVPADRPEGELRVVLPRREKHDYSLDHREGRFWIRTNDAAKNFRLVTAPAADPRKENWTEVLPARPGVKIEDVECFRGHVVVSEREGGLERLRIVPGDGSPSWAVDFPEPAYSVFGEPNEEFGADVYRFRYQSMVTPSSIYEYDVAARKLVLLKRTEVPGDFDAARYVTERVWVEAKDGTKIPVSLLYRKGLAKDGTAPLHLNGYGSYGYPYPVTFSVWRLSLADRGVVVATAHIRGGGEMGEEWYDAGKLQHKVNTFTDFIAVAEGLVKQKWAAKNLVVAEGGSAGGLLIGAVANMRPDLWRALVAHVPFVDVMNTMLDPTLPLTVGEYLEWGDPNKPEDYRYMKSYCPYTNVRKKKYASMLVTTSLNDSQVGYWEPAKWVAKLRAHKTDGNPLLFRCNMDAGHGGASGRYDALKERAFEMAYALWEMGIRK